MGNLDFIKAAKLLPIYRGRIKVLPKLKISFRIKIGLVLD